MSRYAIAALGLLLASEPAEAGGKNFAPLACAPGYHVDRGGACQPDAGEHNRYCPDGLVFHPAFDGWTCDPPPPQAY